MGFDRADLLKSAGVTEGDRVPLRETQVSDDFNATSNTSFTPVGGNLTQRLNALQVNWPDVPGSSFSIAVNGETSTLNQEIVIYEATEFGKILTQFTDSIKTPVDDTFTTRHTFSGKPTAFKRYGVAHRSTDGNQAVIRAMQIVLEIEV